MGGGRSRPAAVRHVYHPPDTSALDLRHKQAMEAAERERAALAGQLDALTKQVAANAEAQKKKDAEMAALKAVVDKIDAEKRAKDAEFQRRHDEEAARIAAIGMDHTNCFNIAFCGVSGAGKSTANNALRGLASGHPDACKTCAGAECTTVSAKYAHPQAPYLMLWDVPGGGTDAHPAATYFSDKCLDLFDLLVLCYDGRWSAVNTQIVKEAARTGTNIVILYTKADNHVKNMVREDDSLTRLEAFAQLKRTVEEDVAAKLAACGVVTLKMPVMLVDCYGIRDNRYEFDEIAFIRAIVSSTALRLNKSPEEVWGTYSAAHAAEGLAA